jgi:2-amino-4-hydroxy-6-hydroxymethyldihydropteridine diphosphokinase
VTGTAERVYLALGSNLGDRDAHLRKAREALADASSVEETRPLGGMHQPAYLNQMVLIGTELEPRALLAACQAIESRAGRTRSEHWGPRTLDIDIVRYGNREISEPDLVIPHPGVTDRDFWQRELAELERHER